MPKENSLAFNTGSSILIKNCQVCGSSFLKSMLFLGYLPPVNLMEKIGTRPFEQPSYPAEWLYCPKCHLVQLGVIVDPIILFPYEYPYTSSTTKVLSENFTELSQESIKLIDLKSNDLVIDIGSNDGNLLEKFKNNYRVLGITPEEIGKVAIQKGIDTIIDYFSPRVVNKIIKTHGRAKIVTATNVFAHMENIHQVIRDIKKLMTKDGVFISESHYLYSLIKTLQYDTIYHEHMRYYSLASLKYLLSMHGLEVFHAKKIPSHGGSMRVYAAGRGKQKILPTVKKMLTMEKSLVTNKANLLKFQERVTASKLSILALLNQLKKRKKKIYGIGAPSRASTLINYVGIDDGMLDCVLEIGGSHKIGKYVPGTVIPVLDEEKLYRDKPDYAMLLSWHIAEELAPKIKAKGFRGDFIIPLPTARIFKI